MSDPKPRGRPKTAAPLSTAERTRRLIGKADAALHPDTALGPLPASVLLLALTKAYRAKSASAFTRITSELSQRLGLSVATTDIPTDPIPVVSTDIQPSIIPVDTTNIADAFSLTPSAPDAAKPISERDVAILELHEAGVPLRQIAAQFGFKSDNSIRHILKQHTQSEGKP